jgi:hypothetical protein
MIDDFKKLGRDKKKENSYEKMRQSPCFFSVWVEG